MAYDVCKKAEEMTVKQSKSSLWYELRYGRVTASKIYEASRCKTADGSLVQGIFGATLSVDTPAMKRGRDIEDLVLREVAKTEGLQFKKCGIFLSAEHPTLGSSPDGINDQFCLEIKCPTTMKHINTYLKNNEITPKFKAQVQIQMHFCQKKESLFVVADPEFEKNGKYIKVIENYDAQYCANLIKQAETFWNHYVYSIFNQS